MWDFLRPRGRQHAVEWFQNIYANVTALYPAADISFIGHSNGTYLGTEALQCSNLNYRFMILAGSVVRSDFWINSQKGLLWRRRVERLFSFRSLDDWVVAMLPGGLEVIPLVGKWMNLGGAGAYGFRGLEDGMEQRVIRGGHGAAIESDTWEQLADFLLCEVPRSALLGQDGHLKPVSPGEAPFLWSLNRFLKWSTLPRLIVGLLILVAMAVCVMPLLVPLVSVVGLPLPGLILAHPMRSMLAVVVLSMIAFSCLKNI